MENLHPDIQKILLNQGKIQRRTVEPQPHLGREDQEADHPDTSIEIQPGSSRDKLKNTINGMGGRVMRAAVRKPKE